MRTRSWLNAMQHGWAAAATNRAKFQKKARRAKARLVFWKLDLMPRPAGDHHARASDNECGTRPGRDLFVVAHIHAEINVARFDALALVMRERNKQGNDSENQ